MAITCARINSSPCSGARILAKKRANWIDAYSKLKLDRGILKDMEELLAKGATAESNVRKAQRDVDSDVIALNKAEHTLLSWGLKEREMAEIRAEAEKPDHNSKDHRLDFEHWARVEIRSPQDGTIMEANVALHDQPDTATNLFQISDTSRLVVWVNLYEEDLPTIRKLPMPLHWVIKLPSQPGVSYPGFLDQIGEIIDSSQHTALVHGFVDNSRGDLLVGQGITAHIEIPPSPNELEIPTGALVEDGHDSIVFVQDPNDKQRFQRHTVTVTRAATTMSFYLRADDSSKDALRAGDRVISGVLG